MAVQYKNLVGGFFILADPTFEQRCVSQCRKALTKIDVRSCQPRSRDLALHGGGINDRSARVVSDLEAAPVIPRNAIEEVLTVIKPNCQLCFGEPQVASGGTEEEYLLTTGKDDRSQEIESF